MKIRPNQFEIIEQSQEAMGHIEKYDLTFWEFAEGFALNGVTITPELDDDNQLCYEWRVNDSAGYCRTIADCLVDAGAIDKAISDYKRACESIDKAYTDEAMEQCRVYAQQKHDDVFTLADKLGIDASDIDLTL